MKEERDKEGKNSEEVGAERKKGGEEERRK